MKPTKPMQATQDTKSESKQKTTKNNQKVTVNTNSLYYGDCLEVLKSLPRESVDLIYLDPPFFSNRNYEVIWGDDGEVRSFTDRWSGGMDHYIGWLKERVEEMYHVLKPTGSIYLHCDWHADAYIRVQILDKIFGYDNFKNEIIWCYTGNSIPSKHFPRKHDNIFWYSKSSKSTYYPVIVPYAEATLKRYNHVDENGNKYKISALRNGKQDIVYMKEGKHCLDHWNDIPFVGTTSSDRIGYPTQKPEALLERIIKASSNEGDVILDPFVGGGTTVSVAQRLGRQFIGIDTSPIAIAVSEARLEQSATLYTAPFSVITKKYDYNQIRNSNAFEFEKFIVEKFDGISNTKQIGDMGLDGTKDKKPIQVKRSDNIGRNVVDNFLSACKRFDSKIYDKAISQKEPIGWIIAFSFGKGAVEEVARLKNEENIIIELKKVDEIIPLSTNPKVEIIVNQSQQKDKGWEITFEAKSDQDILQYQWDFNYNDDSGFKPSKIYSENKNNIVEHSFTAGKYTIACRATNEDGVHGIELINIIVNGKVEVKS